MKNNRIALFIPTLNGGGAERVIANLSNGLISKGYIVDLILSKSVGPFLEELNRNINIIDLNCSSTSKSLPGLIKYLRDKKPLTLISAMHHSNIVALLAKQLSFVDVKVIISVHNHYSSTFKNPTVKDRLLTICMKYVYPWAEKIVAVSKEVKEDLVENLLLEEKRVEVIYNPVIDDKFIEMSERTISREWLQEDGKQLILGVGRLNEVKDFSTLIKAFSIITKDIPSKLVILGEGKEREKLSALIKELNLEGCVYLPGFDKEAVALYKYANVFVLSSLTEGFGNVIVEALANGTPVVTTACVGGPKEIVNFGEYGQIVPVANYQLMAQAIKDQLVGPINKNSLKSRANDFTVKKITEDYISLLH